MKRRYILLTIGSTAGVGGYRWLSRSPVDPKPVPVRPENLTPETVTSYAKEHETAILHNRTVRNTGSDAEILIGCRSMFDRAVGDAYLVILLCGGSVYDGPVHDDRRYGATTYIVTSQSTTRFEEIGHTFARGYPDRAPILRCANFQEPEQTVSITVTPHNGTAPVFTESITVPGERDETIETVVDDYGTYDVTARLGDDTTETYEWEYTEDTAADSIGIGVYIMPDGAIDIDRLKTE